MKIFLFEIWIKIIFLKDNNDTNVRKATANIVSNLQCEKNYKSTTSDNICIVGGPLRSVCVVSYWKGE